MKKAIGSILCVLAMLLIFGKLVGQKPDTTAHNIQDGAVIGVLLAIGIPLSQGKKKLQDSDKHMDISTPPAQTTAFPYQAAKSSWASAVIVFLLLGFAGRTSARVIIELVALLLIVVGLVLGIIALFGIRKHGTKGILAPALVGIVINGLLVFIFVTNFQAASARARQAATAAVSSVAAVNSQSPNAKSQDVVTLLCKHIIEKRRKMIVDTNQTETVWSDGAMLEVGTNYPSGLQELIARPSRYHDIRSFVKQLDTGHASGWKEASVNHSLRKDGYATIASLDGKISAPVESLYVEYLSQRYPTASIRIRSQLEPIIFVVEGQIRASVMPLKN